MTVDASGGHEIRLLLAPGLVIATVHELLLRHSFVHRTRALLRAARAARTRRTTVVIATPKKPEGPGLCLRGERNEGDDGSENDTVHETILLDTGKN
jgi:hypothetical protein